MRQTDPLDLSYLRRQVRAAWGNAQATTPEAIAAAATASAELAHRAYAQDDRAARRQAESTIYFLNIESCFAPPVDPAVGVVWSTLMQAKLAGLRREFAGDLAGIGEPTTEDMQARLEAAVAKWGAFNHPLLGDLESSGSLAAYRVWAKNWFGSCYGFSLQLASLVQRTTGEAKKAVLENLNDEFDDTVTHDVLRVRFYESLGLSFSSETAIDDADWVLDSTELLNLRTALVNQSDPMPALGCFYTVEANWPPECRIHHAMNKQRGLDDHTVEYWTTHAFADEHHSEEWLDVVKGLCRNGAQRAAVVEGAIVQLRLRWRMYDAIRARAQLAAG
jgi:pyrroloquinoline quinone (PQQ) biosynthesis protein C